MRPIDFHPRDFSRCEKHRMTLDFSAEGHSLSLPVLLAKGAQKGETLVVTAGVHGDEFEGVGAIYELFDWLDPAAMRGDVLTVPVANGPAFWSATRTSPLDGKNLARVFPGHGGGSPTEAIAYWVGRCAIAHATFYIDLHSAGVACTMPQLVGYWSEDPRAAEAAAIFGAPVIWGHPAIAEGRSVSAAKDRGIPFLYTEMRGAGRIHPEDRAFLSRGLRNLLCHLRITEGEMEAGPRARHLIGDGNIDHSVSAANRGFLVPAVDLLERVEQGTLLGRLLNMTGEVIEEYAAPADGVVVLVHARPMVQPGEPLFLLADEPS